MNEYECRSCSQKCYGVDICDTCRSVESKGEWSCPACTLFNNPRHLACDVCQCPRPSAESLLHSVEDFPPLDFKLQREDKHSLSDDDDHHHHDLRRKTQDIFDSEKKEERQKKSRACSICTYENPSDYLVCGMCNTQRRSSGERKDDDQDFFVASVSGDEVCISINPSKYRDIFTCMYTGGLFETPITYENTGQTYSEGQISEHLKKSGKSFIVDPYTRKELGEFFVDLELQDLMVGPLATILKEKEPSSTLTIVQLVAIKEIIESRQRKIESGECVLGVKFRDFVARVKKDVAAHKGVLLPLDITQFFSGLKPDEMSVVSPQPKVKPTTRDLERKLAAVEPFRAPVRDGSTEFKDRKSSFERDEFDEVGVPFLLPRPAIQRGFWFNSARHSRLFNDKHYTEDTKYKWCKRLSFLLGLPLLSYYILRKMKHRHCTDEQQRCEGQCRGAGAAH